MISQPVMALLHGKCVESTSAVDPDPAGALDSLTGEGLTAHTNVTSNVGGWMRRGCEGHGCVR